MIKFAGRSVLFHISIKFPAEKVFYIIIITIIVVIILIISIGNSMVSRGIWK